MVVPYYNPGPNLIGHVAQVIALLRDRGVSFEVIAVSDGSTDGSDSGLEQLGPEVQVVHLPVNQGKGHALRLGLGLGRGRYLGELHNLHPDADSGDQRGNVERYCRQLGHDYLDDGPTVQFAGEVRDHDRLRVTFSAQLVYGDVTFGDADRPDAGHGVQLRCCLRGFGRDGHVRQLHVPDSGNDSCDQRRCVKRNHDYFGHPYVDHRPAFHITG